MMLYHNLFIKEDRNMTDYIVGQRIEIADWTDLYRAGERVVTVVKVSKKSVYITGDKSGKTFIYPIEFNIRNLN